ncbi:DUF3592 domain-containing protein [Actinoplanes sp. NBRC 103695]|uniref:DUF3592 domain-containing protein n=1 Tax=Actinoplanes sp. NBRC 103695 TaxID=3032202 RepID=UPI0024A326F3|nr:DUF3592 domain-containing protein [Actinoplanes sp. NBRC 103695]GLY93181.1 hypothetical protein Acsp02_04370 [Actinoplanes sp. NBRC 103695]
MTGIRRFLTSRLGAWAIALWITTAVLIYVARSDMRALDAFADRGRAATATLTAVEDRGRQNDAYLVTFTTADNRVVNATLWGLPADPRPKVGETMRVVYDTADPQLVKDARPNRFIGRRIMFGIAATSLLTAVLLTTLAVARVRRATRSGSAGPSATA